MPLQIKIISFKWNKAFSKDIWFTEKMKINYKSLPQNDFFYNVIKISASTILSAIAIAIALPIITLIFSADELGKYQLLISVITLFGVVSCFKYEMAIVLPKEDSVAGKVYNLCLYALLVFCTVLAFVLYYCLLYTSQSPRD